MKKMTRDELVSELTKGVRKFAEVSFQGEDLSGITIEGVLFNGCDFVGCTLSNTVVNCTTFSYSTLKQVVIRGAKLENVTFIKVDFTRAHVVDSTFTKVRLRHCSFSFSSFHNTQLRDLYLYFCSFTASTIADCELTILELTRTSFDNITGLDVHSVGPVGTFYGNVVYFPSLNKVFAGCWQGSEEEFFAKCTEVTIKHDAELNLDLATDMVKRFMKKGE